MLKASSSLCSQIFICDFALLHCSHHCLTIKALLLFWRHSPTSHTTPRMCSHLKEHTAWPQSPEMSLRECDMHNSNHLETPPCSPTSGTLPEEHPLIGIFCLCLLPHFSLPGKSFILSSFDFSLNLSWDSTAKKALTCSHET